MSSERSSRTWLSSVVRSSWRKARPRGSSTGVLQVISQLCTTSQQSSSAGVATRSRLPISGVSVPASMGPMTDRVTPANAISGASEANSSMAPFIYSAAPTRWLDMHCRVQSPRSDDAAEPLLADPSCFGALLATATFQFKTRSGLATPNGP